MHAAILGSLAFPETSMHLCTMGMRFELTVVPRCPQTLDVPVSTRIFHYLFYLFLPT